MACRTWPLAHAGWIRASLLTGGLDPGVIAGRHFPGGISDQWAEAGKGSEAEATVVARESNESECLISGDKYEPDEGNSVVSFVVAATTRPPFCEERFRHGARRHQEG